MTKCKKTCKIGNLKEFAIDVAYKLAVKDRIDIKTDKEWQKYWKKACTLVDKYGVDALLVIQKRRKK